MPRRIMAAARLMPGFASGRECASAAWQDLVPPTLLSPHRDRRLPWLAEAREDAGSSQPRPCEPPRLPWLPRRMALLSPAAVCDLATSLISGHFVRRSGHPREPVYVRRRSAQAQVRGTTPHCVSASSVSVSWLHGLIVCVLWTSAAPVAAFELTEDLGLRLPFRPNFRLGT